VQCPAVFCSADEDAVVPPEYHQLVIDAYAGPKRVIKLKGSDHNSAIEGDAEQQLRTEIRWIVETAQGEVGTFPAALTPAIGKR
jgi:pimeloyl-ACP methyl ester carboxylesterase